MGLKALSLWTLYQSTKGLYLNIYMHCTDIHIYEYQYKIPIDQDHIKKKSCNMKCYIQIANTLCFKLHLNVIWYKGFFEVH